MYEDSETFPEAGVRMLANLFLVFLFLLGFSCGTLPVLHA